MEKLTTEQAFRNMAAACHNLSNLDIQTALVLNKSIEVVAEELGLDAKGKKEEKPTKKEKN